MTVKEFCQEKTAQEIGQSLAKQHVKTEHKVEIEEKRRIYDWEGYALDLATEKPIYKEKYLKNFRRYNSILKRANDRLNEVNDIEVTSLTGKDVNPYIELLEAALYASDFFYHDFNKENFKAVIQEYHKVKDISKVDWYFILCGLLVEKFELLKDNIEETIKIKDEQKEQDASNLIDCINNYLDQIEDMYTIIESIIMPRDKYKKLVEKIIPNEKYKQLNIGFTNKIYETENKIIRICINPNNEERFNKEIDFYKEQKDNPYIPKLYKVDNSKTIIPYTYEIIEKVPGKTIYEIWYNLTEEERASLVKQIVDAIHYLHKQPVKFFNWNKKIKEELLKYKEIEELEDCISSLVTSCDIYFHHNKFGLIHGDLHFDNILYTGKEIKLLDFESVQVAPIDYDFRILFQMRETPWKWASIKTDMKTIELDYENIMDLFINNYKELQNIQYLKERLLVYEILDILKEYTKTNNKDLLEKVKKKATKLKYNK